MTQEPTPSAGTGRHTFAPYAPYSDWCSLCDRRQHDPIHKNVTPQSAAEPVDVLRDLEASAGVIAEGDCYDRLMRWIASRLAATDAKPRAK